MSASVTLSGDRIRLRPWRDEDREAFAARAAHNEPGIEGGFNWSSQQL
jgi:hypothetical protein